MAKVRIDVTVKNKSSQSVMTFENTKQLLGFLSRTGGRVLKNGTISI